MKEYEGVELLCHLFLTQAVGQGKWSASRSSCFTLLGTEPLVPTEYKAVWAPRAYLEALVMTNL